MSAAEPGQSDRRWIRQLGSLSGVGLTLVISTVLGLGGGIALDRWLGTAPWLMLVGLLLGIASGFVNLFRAAGILGREGGRLNVTAPADLGRGVWVVAGGLGLGLAVACGLLRGPADAMGALLGSGLTLLNFGGLTWAAERALAGGATSRPVWIGASGLRLGVLGCVAGLAVTHTGVGLPGLLLSLTLVPVAVILAGLRAARAA